ncbi:MAG: prephenate dehydrogenase dimerization domain-containing protein, partial [Myxococcota bacterium]
MISRYEAPGSGIGIVVGGRREAGQALPGRRQGALAGVGVAALDGAGQRRQLLGGALEGTAQRLAVGAQDLAPELRVAVAGSGFRDFTRIAHSDPELWSEILCANRKALSGPLQRAAEELA